MTVIYTECPDGCPDPGRTPKCGECVRASATELPDLSHLQGPVEEDDETWRDYRKVIEHHIDQAPRTLQTRIGPSEIGNPCDACLVSKLAGIPEKRDTAWLSFVGQAVHGDLEGFFAEANARLDRLRYLVEATVSVGTIGGVEITGHSDLFDLWTGTVTDWKIVGATTLKKLRAHGPSSVYRTQLHLYGYAFRRRGLDVRRVQIAFLPRNGLSLSGARVWSEPYDESVAVAAIARADTFAYWIKVLGVETVLKAAGAHTGLEFSCSRYDSTVNQPGHYVPGAQLAGLIA